MFKMDDKGSAWMTAVAEWTARGIGRRILSLVMVTLFVLSGVLATSAATLIVTTTADSGPGSLREAVMTANTNGQVDTITFDSIVFASPQTIVLSSGQLLIDADNSNKLTILGPGANLLTLSGNDTNRIVEIASSAVAEIAGVTMTNGRAVVAPANRCGGAISVGPVSPGEGFVLRDSVITKNFAELCGGGIAGRGRIINSAIYDNRAGSYGGGINASQDITLINSTVSGNRSDIIAGGVYNNGTNVYLINSTVAYNVGFGTNTAGGIAQQGSQQTFPRLYMRNSIIANNLGFGGTVPRDMSGIVISQGYNIIGTSLGITIQGETAGNQLNIDPQLDPELRFNGGAIPTHALSAGSPALDAGDNCVLDSPAGSGCISPGILTDARGTPRPQDGDSNGTSTVDIGAHEVTAAEISTAPAKPDLSAEDDTGISNSDNITRTRDLSLSVGGLSPGATVEIYRGNTLLASQTALSTSISFEDNGNAADTRISYGARQIINGVPSAYSAALFVTIDNTAPTVTINSAAGQADPANSAPINFTAVFSEPVADFDGGKISLTGSTAGVSLASVTVTGIGPSYNVAVANITADGTVRASLTANVIQDFAGNDCSASTSTDNTVSFDATRPTVTIEQAASQLDPSGVLPVNFTVVFSEPVTGFTGDDVSLGGSVPNLHTATKYVSGSGSTYNVAVSNLVSAGGVITASIPAGGARDTAQNTNTASSSQDNSVTVDNVGPTVSIEKAPGQSDPANSMPVNFRVEFSEPVTGFDTSDLSFSGSSIELGGAQVLISGSGTTYTVTIAGLVANGGVLKVQVRPGAVMDSLGNPSLPSTSIDNLVVIDNVVPTVTVEQAAGQADPAPTGPIRFRVTFSETVTGFDSSDILLVGSTANTAFAAIEITGSGRVYDVIVRNILSAGTVTLTLAAGAAKDLRGNDNLASTSADNSVTISNKATLFDFDGDGRSDLSVRRPVNNTWYINGSGPTGQSSLQFGIAGDVIVPADYDGDGKSDLAVFRPSSGSWLIFRSSTQTLQTFSWGASADLPVPSDRDGDGRTDLVLFRPSNNTWYTRFATGTFATTVFGAAGDKPVAGDFDRDGKGDIAIFRPSDNNWYIVKSSLGFFIQTWGEAGDIPVAADFDGDGATDQAVFRPSTGQWFLSRTMTGFGSQTWGQAGDIPVAADYDGDGRADVAVFRPSNATWYTVNSSNGQLIQQFGQTGDVPTQSAFLY